MWNCRWRKESKDSDLTAVAALAHDAVYVMEEAFRALLLQRPAMFRHSARRGEVYNKRQKGTYWKQNGTINETKTHFLVFQACLHAT